MKNHNYFVYITTNPAKSVLYVGLTNDMGTRLQQHFEEKGRQKTFAGRYFCFNLIYYERHQYVLNAISREKEIKKWRREKKEALINKFNPEWRFLNEEIE